MHSPLFASTVTAFETEFFISGLAPLADQLVVLYFVKNSDHMVGIISVVHGFIEMGKCDVAAFDAYMCLQDEEFRARPRLDIILPLHESYEEISSDALTVRNFRDNECRDYRLGETILPRSDFIIQRPVMHNRHKWIFITRALRGGVALLHHQPQRHRRGERAGPR